MEKRVRIEEIQKTVEIKDPDDMLRFLVQLTREERILEEIDELETIYVFCVYVRNADGEKLAEFESPSQKEAEIEFAKKVSIYVALVKAESTPIDDIDLYAEKIHYHRTEVPCCLNCKFCKIAHDSCGRRYFYCDNEDNFIYFQNVVNPSKCKPGRGMALHPVCGGDDKWIAFDPGWLPSELGDVGYQLGCGPNCHFAMDVPKPKVEFYGICKNFEKRKVKSRC